MKYSVFKVVIEIEIDLRKTGPRTPRGSWRSFQLLQKWDLQTATPLPLARVPPFARFPTICQSSILGQSSAFGQSPTLSFSLSFNDFNDLPSYHQGIFDYSISLSLCVLLQRKHSQTSSSLAMFCFWLEFCGLLISSRLKDLSFWSKEHF